MKCPGITTVIDGKSKTLYMKSVKSIEVKTRDNLKKSLKGMTDNFKLCKFGLLVPNTVD